MATKSDKGNGKSVPKPTGETPGKTNPKARKAAEEDDDEDVDDELEIEKTSLKKSPKASGKKGKEEEDDDDEEAEEIVDEWEKPEEEEEWDPDFEEFDLPKSKTKKVAGPSGKKAGKGEEEDEVAFDEEFKDLDLFNDSALDEEDDDY